MSKQHCRMLQSRMLFRHCCRFWQQCRSNVRIVRHCCQKRQQCRTSFALKFRPFDKVERCFDIVAGVDRALLASWHVARSNSTQDHHRVVSASPRSPFNSLEKTSRAPTCHLTEGISADVQLGSTQPRRRPTTVPSCEYHQHYFMRERRKRSFKCQQWSLKTRSNSRPCSRSQSHSVNCQTTLGGCEVQPMPVTSHVHCNWVTSQPSR